MERGSFLQLVHSGVTLALEEQHQNSRVLPKFHEIQELSVRMQQEEDPEI